MGTAQSQSRWERRQDTQEQCEGSVLEYMDALSLADPEVVDRSVINSGGSHGETFSIALPKRDALMRGVSVGGDVLIKPVGPGFIVIPTSEL